MNRPKAPLPFTPALATLIAVAAIVARAAPPANADQAIVHVLNRIGFGPRPGDLDRVQKIGLRQYVEQQLHPASLSDAGMASRLDGMATLTMSSRAIADRYERP